MQFSRLTASIHLPAEIKGAMAVRGTKCCNESVQARAS